MLKVGLTGNYGMGKSSVTGVFRKLGAVTVDSDEIVASLLMEDSVKGLILGLIGIKALNPDGSLNKLYIAGKVFKNKALRKRLEALLHPLVFENVGDCIKKVRDRKRIIIIEVPLLFEGGYQSQFDRTVTVFASRKIALSRLTKAGISQKQALERLRTQMDIRTKKRLADYRINNNGTKKQTAAQVRKIYQLLVEENEKRISKGQHRP